MRRLTTSWLHSINRFVMFSLMVLYVPAILATVAGMCWGGYVLTVSAFGADEAFHIRSRFFVSLVLALDLVILGASLLLLVGLLPLAFRSWYPEQSGVVLTPEEHPKLFELLERFCKRLRTRRPDLVLLTPFDETGIAEVNVVTEDGTAHRRVRTLSIGATHVVRTRMDEFMTILCHEVAHAAAGDLLMGRIVDRFFRSLSFQIELYADDENDEDEGTNWLHWLLMLMLMGYYRLFALMYCAESRRREYMADRTAALICGAQSVRRMLIKIHLPDQFAQLDLRAMLYEYWQNEQPMENIYEANRKAWSELPRSRIEAAENAMFMKRHSRWSSHPCLRDRIRNLSGIEAKELILDKPATRLFRDWPELEETITGVLIQWGRAAFDEHLKALDRQLRSDPRV